MNFLNFESKIRGLIERVESPENHLILYIASFFAAITLRSFLEVFSGNTPISFRLFSQWYAFYIFVLLAFVILYYIATREEIEKISKTLLTVFFISVLPPIFDLILNGGSNMGYMEPHHNINLLREFFTFFGSYSFTGISWGLKIEFFVILIGTFTYFRVKNKGRLRSLFFTFLAYALIFISVSIPFVYEGFLTIFGLSGANVNSIMIRNFFLFLIFLESIVVFLFYRRKYFFEILRDIRPFRLAHFILMVIFGVGVFKSFFSVEFSYQLTQSGLFFWIFFPISICFAWLFSVIVNNIIDYEIDRVSNEDRPSVTGSIPRGKYKMLAFVFFVLSLVFALSISYRMAFFITLFMGNYFLYSSPPWRLKRVPFFSWAVVSLNSLILVIAGFCHVSHLSVYDFPSQVIFFLMVFFTAAFNAGDLKDYKGDKKVGVKTLPTVLGLRRSKLVIGFFLFVAYISIYFLVVSNLYLLLVSIVFGFLQFYFVNRENYSEKPIFIIHTMLLIILLIVIW